MTGGVVRALTRGGWGIATFETLDDVEHYVQEAAAAAAVVGKETTQLAEVTPVDAERRARLDTDFRGVSLDEKLKLIAEYNRIILEHHDAIESTHIHYADGFRTVAFASSEGAYFLEERPRVTLHISAVARRDALVQRAGDGWSSAVTFDVVRDRQDTAAEIAARAVALLDAPPADGGPTTVILDQQLAGVFAHEAFGHLSEADFLYENPKMRDLMHVGREMGVEQLNVIDDGSMPGLVGTQAFDDEGTPTHKTSLIRDGVLAGHLHSRETAAKMGAAPTGNARAIGMGHAPIVRMTNTYIAPGAQSFDDLVAGVDKGVYACAMLGGQTMMEMFTFSAAYGYRIENGKVGELVRDVVLTGNVFETLHAIDGFGNDLEMIQKGGGCGKGGQSPLPVTFGSPHLRIRNVVVGGQQ